MEAEKGVGFGGQPLRGMRTERIVREVHAVPMVAVETPLFLRKGPRRFCVTRSGPSLFVPWRLTRRREQLSRTWVASGKCVGRLGD